MSSCFQLLDPPVPLRGLRYVTLRALRWTVTRLSCQSAEWGVVSAFISCVITRGKTGQNERPRTHIVYPTNYIYTSSCRLWIFIYPSVDSIHHTLSLCSYSVGKYEYRPSPIFRRFTPFSVNKITREPLHLAWWNFARTCILTTSRSLLNIKAIGRRSKWDGFWFFCALDTAVTRGQYLASSKDWQSCLHNLFVIAGVSFLYVACMCYETLQR